MRHRIMFVYDDEDGEFDADAAYRAGWKPRDVLPRMGPARYSTVPANDMPLAEAIEMTRNFAEAAGFDPDAAEAQLLEMIEDGTIPVNSVQ